MKSIGDVRHAWVCVDALSVGVMHDVWRPLLFIAWDIGWHNIDWGENYLFRKVLRHHHLVRKAASGSVEENATLRD